MKTILQLNTSLNGEQALSSRLASELSTALAAASGATVVVRDLAGQPLPHLTAERFAAFVTPASERTVDQRKRQPFTGNETVVRGEGLGHAADAHHQGGQLMLGALLVHPCFEAPAQELRICGHILHQPVHVHGGMQNEGRSPDFHAVNAYRRIAVAESRRGSVVGPGMGSGTGRRKNSMSGGRARRIAATAA